MSATGVIACVLYSLHICFTFFFPDQYLEIQISQARTCSTFRQMKLMRSSLSEVKDQRKYFYFCQTFKKKKLQIQSIAFCFGFRCYWVRVFVCVCLHILTSTFELYELLCGCVCVFVFFSGCFQRHLCA